MRFPISCGLLVAALLVLARPRPAAAQDSELPHLRELVGNPSYRTVSQGLEHAVEERLTLPPGYPTGLDYGVLVHLEVSLTGQVENPSIVPQAEAVNPVIASAIVAAVRQLPVLVPGHRGGQPVRTALTLLIQPGVAAAAADEAAAAQAAAATDSTEARTLRTGTIRRQPGEALGQLLHRTLPASCPDSATQLVRYAWLPNPAGPQLFFHAPGHGEQDEQYEAVLFVLNPSGAETYNVQAFNLGSMGDYTDVISIFFADANHDGQKDLLALTQCDLREGPTKKYPLGWREAHYQTTAFYYRGLDGAGRPRYEQQYRENLDDLATAAEVRQALAAPPRPHKKAAPRNPRGKSAN